jgi:hypothetical protein
MQGLCPSWPAANSPWDIFGQMKQRIRSPDWPGSFTWRGHRRPRLYRLIRLGLDG